MFRSVLCAAGVLLALAAAGGVAVASVPAADTGPDSQACKSATSAAAQAQVDVDAAQKAYDDAKAKGDTTNSALQQLLDTLNAKKSDLQAKLATKTSVCAGSTTTTTPPPGGGDTYNTCAEYNSHGIFAIPRSDARYRAWLDRDHDGRACERHEGTFRDGHWFDDQGVVISDDGNCVTYVNDNRDYGLRYRGLYDDRQRLLDLARRADSDGGTIITDREWRSIRLHDGELRDYWGRYRTSSDRLKTICKQNPVVVVNNPPPDVSSSSNGNPTYLGSGGGQVSQVPMGAAQTGDGSTVIG